MSKSELKNDMKTIFKVIKWSVLVTALLFSIYSIAAIVIWTMTCFTPSPDKDLVAKYQAAAAVTGENWGEMLAFDTVRYRKDYKKADANKTALDLWIIDIKVIIKNKVYHTHLGSRNAIERYLMNSGRSDLIGGDVGQIKSFFDSLNATVTYDARTQRDIEDLLETDEEVEWFNMLLQDNAIEKMYGGFIPLPENIKVTTKGFFTYPSPTAMIVTSEFGPRYMPTVKKQTGRLIKRMHQGLDFAKAGNAYGEPVIASAAGTVITASSNVSGYGVLIKIKHVDPSGNQWETRYGHLSELLVSPGQTVSQGDVIGRIGNSGVSTGAHLHFEIRFNGEAQNPRLFLGKSFNKIGN